MDKTEKDNIKADLEKIVFKNNLFNSSLNTIFGKLDVAHKFLEDKIKAYDICSEWDAEALRDLSTLRAIMFYLDDLSNEWNAVKGRQEEVMNQLLYVLDQPYKIPVDLMKKLWEEI